MTLTCLLKNFLEQSQQFKYLEVSLIKKEFGIENRDFGNLLRKLLLFVLAALLEVVEISLLQDSQGTLI